jgi:lycopene cyclase domain-containing protein
MLKFSYALGLLLAITGVGMLDWHGKLAFWYDRKRTLLTVATALVVFIIWDVLGITFDIFRDGDSPYTLSIFLMPQFPVEELLFLFLI